MMWASSMIKTLRHEGREIRFYEWVQDLSSGIALDVRYARTDNFIGVRVYPEARVFLLEHVACDLLRVRDSVAKHGFGLLLFDGYRPWSVSKYFWDHSSDEVRGFLADPAEGSAHNRGCAVDLSLFHLSGGEPVGMPSDFDEMNAKSYRDYPGGEPAARQARDLLRDAMEKNGFSGIPNEWWHFNHGSRHEWPVMDFGLPEIVQAPQTPPRPRES
jgi:D-alanyl-D-alanine dipeptidase